MLSLPNKNFQPILFTYPFQSLANVRICVEAEISAQICLKVRNFHWKIVNFAQRSDSLCLRRLGDTPPDPHLSHFSLTDIDYPGLKIMTSYIMYNILKPSVFWKIWQRGPLTSFLGGEGVSDGLDPTLIISNDKLK